jgi:hypothetical protein
MPAEHAQLMLPMAQRAVVAVVDLDHIEQRLRMAAPSQACSAWPKAQYCW